MSAPYGFTWVDHPHLAGMARPGAVEDLAWLRGEGIELIITLTEYALPRNWINEAGLFSLHLPVADFTPPTQEQLLQGITTIQKVNSQGRGAVIHCAAGLGRTGTFLACYFVAKDLTPQAAISKVRRLRPGSIETEEQEAAITEFAETWKRRVGS